ncbi:MAG TPA: hypothetical protein VGG27_14160 [Magnetospirillaceae bacterium]|jgi:hypothetical protein
MTVRLTLSVLAVAGFAGLSAAPAFADATQEIATAGQHAGMAAGSADLKMVHMHLQHVVNCIVGPAGAGFDKAAGNPCDGKGNGAAADGGDKAKLDGALAKAKEGIASDDLATARKDASDVQAMLTK